MSCDISIYVALSLYRFNLKGILPGFSPFLRGNSVRFFSEIYSTNSSDPMGVRGVTKLYLVPSKWSYYF